MLRCGRRTGRCVAIKIIARSGPMRLAQIYIKDVKSSNGTFINGERLSPESVESEPFELKSDDIVVRVRVALHSHQSLTEISRNLASISSARITKLSSITKSLHVSHAYYPPKMPLQHPAIPPNTQTLHLLSNLQTQSIHNLGSLITRSNVAPALSHLQIQPLSSGAWARPRAAQVRTRAG